jgi:hypothetical protein
MSQAAWLGPRDAWPAHSRPLAQRALKRLRVDGWYLKRAKAGAKGWGTVTCADPTLYGPDMRCTTFVSSTSGPADGSETAKTLEALNQKCPHDRAGPAAATAGSGANPDDSDALTEAATLIERAEHAVTAAERLKSHGSHRHLMEDFFARAAEDVAEAERLLDIALDHEQSATVELEEAEEAARVSGAAVSLGVDGLAGRAEVQIEQAEVILLRQPGPPAPELRRRCEAVRERVRELDG